MHRLCTTATLAVAMLVCEPASAQQSEGGGDPLHKQDKLAAAHMYRLPGRGHAFSLPQVWRAVAGRSIVFALLAPLSACPEPRAPIRTLIDDSSLHANCTAARAAGATPINRCEHGYAQHLDRDNDGVGCE